ncbi:hypothetical protein LTS18_013703, partial [Coniosporium uncinatum]
MPHFAYTLHTTLSISPTCVACIAILKRPQPLDPSLPLTSQVQVINLPAIPTTGNASLDHIASASPFEVLHSVIHLALAPYFEAYTRQDDDSNRILSRGESEGRTGIPGAKKKLAELEASLLQLQQNVEIPSVSLRIHPVIFDGLRDCAQRNIYPANIEGIPFSVRQDTKIQNEVQKAVSGWIQEIQTVTKTDRDPSNGSAGQEISFWLNFETRLGEISKQLESEGVRLTLEFLRSAKRYNIETSFRTDTNLKEVTENIIKYNILMRDFPLNELLSATTLNKVQEAILMIFGHMNKKLKLTPYPIRRALSLVEAISGDLDDRLHALLHGRSLMHLEYPEFQAVMRAAESIWRA